MTAQFNSYSCTLAWFLQSESVSLLNVKQPCVAGSKTFTTAVRNGQSKHHEYVKFFSCTRLLGVWQLSGFGREHHHKLPSAAENPYLIECAVCFQLFVVGVLDENRDISHLGSYRRIIVHHGDGCFLCAHFQECLKQTRIQLGLSRPTTSAAEWDHPLFIWKSCKPPSSQITQKGYELTNYSTWFLPFSIRMLVTFPKGRPRAMTSVSDTSLGSFLMWMTLEGGFSSTLSFLLSLPLAEKTDREDSPSGHNTAVHAQTHTLSKEAITNAPFPSEFHNGLQNFKEYH